MQAWRQDDIVGIITEDVPPYKKGGSLVRNNYHWALKAIACHARRDQDWEYDEAVWPALGRLLAFFTVSGYLGLSETLLEFPPGTEIPETLRSVSTWQ